MLIILIITLILTVINVGLLCIFIYSFSISDRIDKEIEEYQDILTKEYEKFLEYFIQNANFANTCLYRFTVLEDALRETLDYIKCSYKNKKDFDEDWKEELQLLYPKIDLIEEAKKYGKSIMEE